MKLIKLGLTGSIGMGKTHTTQMFKNQVVPIFEADNKVHELFKKNNTLINLIDKNFQGAVIDNMVDRKVLGNLVFSDKSKKEKLESIVHPFVRIERKKFTNYAIRNRFSVILYDIPLLFETKSEKYYDYIIVVSAPKFIQEKRVLKRSDMTKEKYIKISEHQMSDHKKRIKADFVVFSGLGVAPAFNKVKLILRSLRNK